ncbi:MAG: hypothetical protein NZ480_04360, partial [Bdellovibrionaceae bacterium]|nr:hypothetical protein [Pseudobdellovibrionaceae bacterium]
MLAESIKNEWLTIVQFIEPTLEDLELRFLDPREKLKASVFSGLLAVSLGKHFKNKDGFTYFVSPNVDENVFVTHILASDDEALFVNDHLFSAINLASHKFIWRVTKKWKNYKVILWLQPNLLKSLKSADRFLFDSFWLLNAQNQILFHESSEFIGQFLSRIPGGDFKGVWEGKIDGIKTTWVRATIAQTNLVALGMWKGTPQRESNRGFFVWFVALGVVLLGLGSYIFWVRSFKGAANSLKAVEKARVSGNDLNGANDRQNQVVFDLPMVPDGIKIQDGSSSQKHEDSYSQILSRLLDDNIGISGGIDEQNKDDLGNKIFAELSRRGVLLHLTRLARERDRYFAQWVDISKLQSRLMRSLSLSHDQIVIQKDFGTKTIVELRVPLQLLIAILNIFSAFEIERILVSILEKTVNVAL